jgi:hypothetical protein
MTMFKVIFVCLGFLRIIGKQTSFVFHVTFVSKDTPKR